jgi:maltooligosyltrehalose trehalohydrolase
VREYFLANAAYWIDEYHFDGLRLDATDTIYDESEDHVLAALARRARAAAGKRGILLIAENEPQHARLARPAEEGGYGLDALWNDDFHHSAHVALTGRSEAYYTGYHGKPQELISSMKWGYLYQGQRCARTKKRRGTPSRGRVPPAAFVTFLQNHDQISNSGRGLRIHQLTSPSRYRALTALMLLGPGTPLLFQGQEFAASSPFLFFADHTPALARLVRKGRAEFLSQFPSVALPEVRASLADPADPATFAHCKLDVSERKKHAEEYALHRDLLQLRRDDPVFRAQRPGGVDGAVLGARAFVLRFFGEGDDRLLLVNLGRDLHLPAAPEPLLAPIEGKEWAILWSSESPRYGASGGTPAVEREDGWHLPGEAAVVLRPLG